MAHWKQALSEAKNWDYACNDLIPPDSGHILVYQDNKDDLVYHVDGTINGTHCHAQAPVTGMDRVMEELTINPRTGWYSV